MFQLCLLRRKPPKIHEASRERSISLLGWILELVFWNKFTNKCQNTSKKHKRHKTKVTYRRIAEPQNDAIDYEAALDTQTVT